MARHRQPQEVGRDPTGGRSADLAAGALDQPTQQVRRPQETHQTQPGRQDQQDQQARRPQAAQHAAETLPAHHIRSARPTQHTRSAAGPVAPATRWPVAPTTYPLPEVPARPPVPPGPPRPPVSPEPPAPGPLAPSRPPRRPEESGLPVGAPAAEPRGLDDPTGTFTRALLTGLGGGAETTSAAPVRPRRRSEPVTATERALARAGDGWATTVATARRLGGRLAALRGDERTALLAVVAVVGVVLLAIVVLLVAARLTADRASQGRHGPSVAPSRTGSPLPPAGGSFAARHSGLCLAPPVGRKDEGAQLVQRTCGTDPAAGFHLVAAGGRADAYALVDAGTGRCADVLGGGEGDSVPVVQWECHGADNQTFELRPVPGLDGYVQIVADHSGKCVDVTGASKDEGAPIQQYACHDPATEARMGNQAWRLTPG